MKTSNWFPANAKFVKPYKTSGLFVLPNNFKAPLNIVPGTGTRNARFREAVLEANSGRAKPDATVSRFGTVGLVDAFAIKTMDFLNKDMDYLKVFLNEVKVGTSPGIEKVGPKIYAWRVTRTPDGEIKQGQYIMDNYNYGLARDEKVQKLSMYMKRFSGGACPMKGDPIFQKVKSAMVTFWRATKGYHGDLHTNNMAVIIDTHTGKPKKVIVFDYGAHRPFKKPPPVDTCFKDYISLIKKEFRETFHRRKATKNPHENTVKQTIFQCRNQPFRCNAAMLNKMKQKSPGNSKTPSVLKYISNKPHVSQSPMRRQPAVPKKRTRWFFASPSSSQRPSKKAKSSSHVSETPLSKQRKQSSSHVSETPQQKKSASTTR